MLYAHPLYVYIWGVKCAIKGADIIGVRGVGGKGGVVKGLDRERNARVKSRAKRQEGGSKRGRKWWGWRFFIIKYIVTSFLCFRGGAMRKGGGTRGEFDAFFGGVLVASAETSS